MEKYIRFGYIPKSGRSLNYLKLSGSQREDITDAMRDTDLEPEEALRECIELFGWKKNIDDCFENGLSVFKADENGLPVIESIEQAESLAHRIGKEVIFAVYGYEVGIGQDGEPLVSVSQAEQTSIPDESLQNVIHRFLESNYSITEKNESNNQNTVYTSYRNGVKSYIYMGIRYE